MERLDPCGLRARVVRFGAGAHDLAGTALATFVLPGTRRYGSRWLALALVAVLMAGCGRDGSTKASRSGPSAATNSPARANRTAACPNPEGGECRGRLSAGSYRTVEFTPAITYTVPDGWQNFEDTPGNFQLVPPHQSLKGVAGTSDFIGVYAAVRAAAQDCSELPAASVPESPTAIARWMTRLAGVNATQPPRVAVGGLRGVVLDVSMVKGWKKTCPWSGPTPVVLLIVGVNPSGLTHGLIPTLTMRLYLLRNGAHVLAIEVDDVPGGQRLNRYATVAERIRFVH